MHYTLINQDSAAHHLRLRVSNELCPDYAAVLLGGCAALSFFERADGSPSVMNQRTKNALALKASRDWTQLEHTANLLALEVWLTFEFDLAPRSTHTFEIELNIHRP